GYKLKQINSTHRVDGRRQPGVPHNAYSAPLERQPGGTPARWNNLVSSMPDAHAGHTQTLSSIS
ncbi:MAG: hypothetical protein RJQ14_10830, partial [Marinoscillum sp.]